MSTNSGKQEISGRNLTVNAALAITTRMVLRLIGLVSIIILARLLTPDDFGLVALAMAPVAVAEAFSYLGVRSALVRHSSPTKSDYDTAWTFNFIINISVGLFVVIVLAPATASFFGKPELRAAMSVISIKYLFVAVENIATINYEREFHFGKDLKYRVVARAISFVLIIAAAYGFRSYWALVIGVVLNSAALTICSYITVRYRPRMSLRNWNYYLSFSFWSLFGGAVNAIAQQVERLLLGKTADSNDLGYYSTSQNLAAIFIFEPLMAVGRVVLPAVSVVKKEKPGLLRTQVNVGIGAYAAFAFPVGFGLASISHEFIEIVLGEKWLPAGSIFFVISLALSFRAAGEIVGKVLVAVGKIKQQSILQLIYLLMLAVGLWLFFDGKNAITLAHGALAANVVWMIVYLLVLVNMRYAEANCAFFSTARPLAAATAMYFVIEMIGAQSGLSGIMLVAIKVFVGVVSYTFFLFGIWLAFLRAEGFEAWLVGEFLMVKKQLKTR